MLYLVFGFWAEGNPTEPITDQACAQWHRRNAAGGRPYSRRNAGLNAASVGGQPVGVAAAGAAADRDQVETTRRGQADERV